MSSIMDSKQSGYTEHAIKAGLIECTCSKCGHKWLRRAERPKRCPNCTKRFKSNGKD